MQNQENKYRLLAREACGALDLSYEELKDKYKNYPVCLMEYMDGSIFERVIEVAFDSQEATTSLHFDKNNICNGSFISFHNPKDEDSFINYLNECRQYDFKRDRWIMMGCYLKAKPSKYEMLFYFYK